MSAGLVMIYTFAGQDYCVELRQTHADEPESVPQLGRSYRSCRFCNVEKTRIFKSKMSGTQTLPVTSFYVALNRIVYFWPDCLTQ